MPFPAVRDEAYSRFLGLAVRIRNEATTASTTMAGSAVSASYALSLLDALRNARTEMQTIAAIPGMAEHATRVSGVADIAADFNAIAAKVDEVGTWLVTNFPKDLDGYLLREQFAAGGARSERTFAPAATAALRTLLDELAALVA